MQNKDIHVVNEFVGATDVDHMSETNLRNNGSKFPAGSRDTMSSGTITGRKRLPGNDEGSRIGPKILEKVGETVKHDEAFNPGRRGCKSIISKTYRKACVLTGNAIDNKKTI